MVRKTFVSALVLALVLAFGATVVVGSFAEQEAYTTYTYEKEPDAVRVAKALGIEDATQVTVDSDGETVKVRIKTAAIKDPLDAGKVESLFADVGYAQKK